MMSKFTFRNGAFFNGRTCQIFSNYISDTNKSVLARAKSLALSVLDGDEPDWDIDGDILLSPAHGGIIIERRHLVQHIVNNSKFFGIA